MRYPTNFSPQFYIPLFADTVKLVLWTICIVSQLYDMFLTVLNFQSTIQVCLTVGPLFSESHKILILINIFIICLSIYSFWETNFNINQNSNVEIRLLNEKYAVVVCMVLMLLNVFLYLEVHSPPVKYPLHLN